PGRSPVHVPRVEARCSVLRETRAELVEERNERDPSPSEESGDDAVRLLDVAVDSADLGRSRAHPVPPRRRYLLSAIDDHAGALAPFPLDLAREQEHEAKRYAPCLAPVLWIRFGEDLEQRRGDQVGRALRRRQ